MLERGVAAGEGQHKPPVSGLLGKPTYIGRERPDAGRCNGQLKKAGDKTSLVQTVTVKIAVGCPRLSSLIVAVRVTIRARRDWIGRGAMPVISDSGQTIARSIVSVRDPDPSAQR